VRRGGGQDRLPSDFPRALTGRAAPLSLGRVPGASQVQADEVPDREEPKRGKGVWPSRLHPGLLAWMVGAFLPLGCLLAADPLDDWQWRNPLPLANRLYSVAYASNEFIAVGLGGAVVTSTNGIQWTSACPGVSEGEHLYGVACGLDLTVAVGDHGVILVWGGSAWTRAATGFVTPLNAVTFGGGLFVAVGSPDDTGNATILTSADGYQWAAAVTATPGTLTAVTQADDLFVAVGQAGLILTSSDAVNWAPVDSGTSLDLNGVTHGQGLFLAVGGGTILTSADGFNWGGPVPSVTNELYAATFAGTNFIAVGAGQILVSGDGTNWVHLELGPNPIDLWGVAEGNGVVAAVGAEWPASTFATGSILASEDASTWTPRTGGVHDQAYYGVACSQGTFVAVGLHSQVPTVAAISVSSDGESWTRPGPMPEGTLSGITYGLGTFVAVGSYSNANTAQMQGRITTSSDGRSWLDCTPGAIPPLLALAFGGDRFVAVGLTNVWTSTNALTWVRPPSPTATNLQAITYGNGLFVGTGRRGTIQTSPDGDLWTTRIPSTPTARTLGGVAFGNNRFVTVGNTGTIILSEDGLTWTTIVSGTADIFYAVAYGNGSFVAVGFASDTTGFSALWTSPDGVSWTQRTPPSVQALRAITYGNGTFLAVGDQGTVLQSGLAADWIVVRATGWQASGFGLSVTASVGSSGRLQASTSLEAGGWADLFGFTNTATTISLIDTSARAFPQRFYRVASP
jgi:hypothetical protein